MPRGFLDWSAMLIDFCGTRMRLSPKRSRARRQPHSENNARFSNHAKTEALIELPGRIVLEESHHDLFARCPQGCKQATQHFRSNAGSLIWEPYRSSDADCRPRRAGLRFKPAQLERS
jgi:hypothetical protein